MQFKTDDNKPLPVMPIEEVATKFPIMYAGVQKAAYVINELVNGHDCGHEACATEHRGKLRAIMDDYIDDAILDAVKGLAHKDSETMNKLRAKIIFGLLGKAIEQAMEKQQQDPDIEPNEEAVAKARELLAKIGKP